MNNKMAKNTYLLTIDSKKQNKQTRTGTESCIQRMFWWLTDGQGCGEMGKEVRGLGSTNPLQNSHGDVKYGIGNGIAKELICMTNGHEHGVGIA